MARRTTTHRPLELSFLFDLYATGQLAITLSDAAVEEHGIADGFAALSLIHSEGPTTPTELARRLGLPPTTASGLVRRLERRGLVHRLPNPEDGRSYLLTLTPRARRALDGARPAFLALLRKVEKNLDSPVEDIRRALLDLQQALQLASNLRI